jgi:phosphoribosylformylglycinamidine (FGAM) synthase-like enzyme
VGETKGELGASMYLRELLGREDGAPPPVDLAVERKAGDLIRSLIESRQVTVVHDLSDGGLIAAAAEMALASSQGLTLKLAGDLPAHAALFGEDQARYLVAVDSADAVLAAAKTAGVPAAVIGVAGGDDLAVEGLFALPLSQLRTAHEGWMPGYMG